MATRPARRPLADTAYDHLRQSIVTLRMAPGTALVELEICARLHVSRTPVRAAIERLHQEGLVTMTGKRAVGRAVVAPLTIDDMRELFLMVGALDGAAARLAAEMDRTARTRLAEALRAVNDELKRVSRSGSRHPADIPRVQDLDLRFHRRYEETAAGPRLLAKLCALHAQRERYVRLYTEALVHAHSMTESIDEHEAIARAIARGDAGSAERAAAFNHRHAIRRFLLSADGHRL